jgi:hypothetical protein
LDMQMRVNFNPYKMALSLACGTLVSACSSLVSIDDELPPPPTSPREARQLRIPADLATARIERNPSPAPAANVVQLPKPAINEAPASNAASGPAPVVVSNQPQAVASAAVEPSPKPPGVFFAPYIPFLKEGSAPAVWQKNPAYDFPWIPGAEPTRVNEETVVGAGEQMLGRLYARKSYARDAEVLKVQEVQTVSLEKDDGSDKKNKKAKNTKAISLEPEFKKEVLKTKSTAELGINCEGVTCLDAARDALAADAESKGWQMLLNRRVSLHQSFQFGRFGRVIWIELNSDGQKELNIEYSLMPRQNVASKK